MTKYNFSGTLVDVKATNLHGSALPISGTMSADNTGATTKISVGTIVMADGTDPTLVDNATAANASKSLGVAIETRNAGDTRPVTYTYFGWVRVMTNNSAILVGSPLKVGDRGKVVLANPAGTAADIPLVIGKALEANGSTDEKIIQALVWFG